MLRYLLIHQIVSCLSSIIENGAGFALQFEVGCNMFDTWAMGLLKDRLSMKKKNFKLILPFALYMQLNYS